MSESVNVLIEGYLVSVRFDDPRLQFFLAKCLRGVVNHPLLVRELITQAQRVVPLELRCAGCAVSLKCLEILRLHKSPGLKESPKRAEEE